MAKLVYDPIEDRKKKPITHVNAESNAKEVNAQASNAEKPKVEKPKAEKKVKEPKVKVEKVKKPAKTAEFDARVLESMKTLTANGLKEFTSTMLRDNLGLDKESGRDQIRKAMARLKKDDKVTVNPKTVGVQTRYVYSLKEP
jgi:hypothetical protein